MMPLLGGTRGAHDDASHQGSAKRDAANGLAGLNGAGDVLATGSAILLARNGTNDMRIFERTASEDAFFVRRMAANDYDLLVYELGVLQQVQTASMKNVASGIAGLDASAALDSLTTRIPRSRSNPARALDTEYQNTTGRDLLVIVVVRTITTVAGGYALATCYTKPTSPADVYDAIVGVDTSVAGVVNEKLDFSATFVVKAGNYYKVGSSTSNGTVTLVLWTEYQL